MNYECCKNTQQRVIYKHMNNMNTIWRLCIAAMVSAPCVLTFFLCPCFGADSPKYEKKLGFIEVSKKNPRYFSFSDGTPYIPIGMNLCFPRPYFYDGTENDAFEKLEEQMARLSKNGGNFVRVWVGADFFNVETKAGEYDAKKMERFKRYMDLARKYGLRVKLCMQHFRSVSENEPDTCDATRLRNQFRQPAYAKLFRNMEEYVTSERGKKLYLGYTQNFASHYAEDPYVFGIELWNEMNTVSSKIEVVQKWTAEILPRVKKQFPHHLVMQSLGSFDSSRGIKNYKLIMPMASNEVAQIHRYLDCGAPFKICHGPVDIFCADAIDFLLANSPGKPALLSESGAVNPKHTGPFNLYAKDTEGVILHDILFAPFFSGSAGAGQTWFWEWYVAKNNLYWHFGRFAKAIGGINPLEENFVPFRFEHEGIRFYALKGKKTILLWARDAQSDWRSELERGEKPRKLCAISLPISKLPGGVKPLSVSYYDPWTEASGKLKQNSGRIDLPEFSRSIVLRMELSGL